MIFQQFNLVKRSQRADQRAGRAARLRQPAARACSAASRRRTYQRALANLERVGIPEKAYQRADTLSGGQQQRVAIARALMQEPQLMLADEPVASLDPATSHSVMKYLEEINREDGITVICNLHFLSLARRYATRVIALKAGQIVFDGLPTEIDEDALPRDLRRGRRRGGDPLMAQSTSSSPPARSPALPDPSLLPSGRPGRVHHLVAELPLPDHRAGGAGLRLAGHRRSTSSSLVVNLPKSRADLHRPAPAGRGRSGDRAVSADAPLQVGACRRPAVDARRVGGGTLTVTPGAVPAGQQLTIALSGVRPNSAAATCTWSTIAAARRRPIRPPTSKDRTRRGALRADVRDAGLGGGRRVPGPRRAAPDRACAAPGASARRSTTVARAR